MMALLPGDTLWDRYRVERIPEDTSGYAWLAPLRPKRSENGPAPTSFLLVPLKQRDYLSALLAAAGTLAGLQTAPPPLARIARLQNKTAVRRQNPNLLPFIGQLEWIGSPERDGMAVIARAEGHTLNTLLRLQGPLSAAQALPLLSDLVEALDQLRQTWADGSPGPRRKAQRALAGLLHPDALLLRAADAKLAFCPAPPQPPAELAPPPWTDFIAPEILNDSAAASPESWAFGVAQLAAFCLCANAETPHDGTWTRLADWSTGRRDPAKEFLTRAAGVPDELRTLLAKALDRNPSRRVASLAKFAAALRQLAAQPWAQLAQHCFTCGFGIDPEHAQRPNAVCACCGTALPKPVAESRNRPTVSLRTRKNDTRTAKTQEQLAAQAAKHVPEGMILISAGSFLSGDRKVPRTLRAFAIDRTPVLEADYKMFLATSGKIPREGGPGSRGPKFDRHPAVGITWFEANEFAEFYGKRLPTVYEWEKAARGSDGRKFPFGNNFRAACGRLRAVPDGEAEKEGERTSVAVGAYPQGASPYGVLDMCGNVLEWTSSARLAGERLFRAVKGACFNDGSTELARCTAVQYIRPELGAPYIGFRCVKDVD